VRSFDAAVCQLFTLPLYQNFAFRYMKVVPRVKMLLPAYRVWTLDFFVPMPLGFPPPRLVVAFQPDLGLAAFARHRPYLCHPQKSSPLGSVEEGRLFIS
jgi:hypothetical protein